MYFKLLRSAWSRKGNKPLERHLNPIPVFQIHLNSPARPSPCALRLAAARDTWPSNTPVQRPPLPPHFAFVEVCGHTSPRAPQGSSSSSGLQGGFRISVCCLFPAYQSRVIRKGQGCLDKSPYLPSRKHKTLISLHNPSVSPGIGAGNHKSIPLGRGDCCIALGQSASGQ